MMKHAVKVFLHLFKVTSVRSVPPFALSSGVAPELFGPFSVLRKTYSCPTYLQKI